MTSYGQIALAAGGVFNLGFAVFHAFFPRLFRWSFDLRHVTVLNRQLVRILNFSMMFVLVMMAYVSLVNGREMLTTSLGRTLLVAFGLFWVLRAAQQGIFFGWKIRSTYKWGGLFLLGAACYFTAVISAVP